MSHYCPRRDDTVRWMAAQKGPTFYLDPAAQIATTPLEDEWSDRDWLNAPGVPECSYCGSIKPDAFIKAIQDGREIHPTDKRYKAYVIMPNPKAGQERIYSAITHEPRPEEKGWTKVTRSNRKLLKRDGWGSDGYLYFRLSPAPTTVQAKFYFHHIAHPCLERAQFYNLLTGGTLPHFYSGGPLGVRLEHIARHPDEMTDQERESLAAFRERNPGIEAP